MALSKLASALFLLCFVLLLATFVSAQDNYTDSYSLNQTYSLKPVIPCTDPAVNNLYCGPPVSNKSGIYCYDCVDKWQYFALVNSTGSVTIDTCNVFASYVVDNITGPYYIKNGINNTGATVQQYGLNDYSKYYNCTFYTAGPVDNIPSCSQLGLGNPNWNIVQLESCFNPFGPPGSILSVFVDAVVTEVATEGTKCFFDYVTGSTNSGIPFCEKHPNFGTKTLAVNIFLVIITCITYFLNVI